MLSPWHYDSNLEGELSAFRFDTRPGAETAYALDSEGLLLHDKS